MINPEYFYFDEIDSTSTEARRMIECGAGDRPFVCRAAYQTGGRGRTGRQFFSPSGSGLYMSLAFKAGDDPKDQVTMTTRAAVAVARVLARELSINPGIKWVNDIYLDGRKVCGILCERMVRNAESYYIIGVGVNVFSADFPGEIADIATTLDRSGTYRGQRLCDILPADRREVLDELTLALSQELLISMRPGYDFLGYYKEKSIVLGNSIYYIENGIRFDAVAVDIDEAGGLIVESEGRFRTLSSGEISLRVKN